MKKNIVGVCAAVAAAVSFAAGEFKVLDSSQGEVGVYDTLTEAFAAVPTGGAVELLADATWSENALLGDNKQIALRSSDGTRFELRRTSFCTLGTANGGGAKLTVSNIILDGGVKWTNPFSQDLTEAQLRATEAGSLIMSSKEDAVPLVTVANGTTVELDNGSVVRNTQLSYKNWNPGGLVLQGAVNVNGGTLKVLAGALICDCRSIDATGIGVIYGGNAHIKLEGGAVTANFCPTSIISGTGTQRDFWISGTAAITNNLLRGNVCAVNLNGGLYSQCYFSGAPIIRDNWVLASNPRKPANLKTGLSGGYYGIELRGAMEEGAEVLISNYGLTTSPAAGDIFGLAAYSGDDSHPEGFLPDNLADGETLIGSVSDGLLVWKDPTKSDPVISAVNSDNPDLPKIYYTLAEAFEGVSDGDTLTLLANMTTDSPLPVDGKKLIFKLAGFKLEATCRNALEVSNGGSVFVDARADGSALTGTIQAKDSQCRVGLLGGSFASSVADAPAVEFLDGAAETRFVACDATVTSASGAAISLQASGEAVFSSASGTVGCTVRGETAALALGAGVRLSIRSGTFDGAITGTPAASEIFGGTFATDPSALCGTGFAGVENGGTWSVVETDGARASVDGGDWTSYSTLDDLATVIAHYTQQQTSAPHSWIVEINHDTSFTKEFPSFSAHFGNRTIVLRTNPELGRPARLVRAKPSAALALGQYNPNFSSVVKSMTVENLTVDFGAVWMWDFDKDIPVDLMLANAGLVAEWTGNEGQIGTGACLVYNNTHAKDLMTFGEGVTLENANGTVLTFPFAYAASGAFEFGKGSCVRDCRTSCRLASGGTNGTKYRGFLFSGGEWTKCFAKSDYGLLYVQNGTVVRMTDGSSIHDNAAKDIFCGAANSGIELLGGSIVSNRLTRNGTGAIYDNRSGLSVILSGAPVVRWNAFADGREFNLYQDIRQNSYLYISNRLDRAAWIGHASLNRTPSADGDVLASVDATKAKVVCPADDGSCGAERVFYGNSPAGTAAWVVTRRAADDVLCWKKSLGVVDSEQGLALDGDQTAGVIVANPSAQMTCQTLDVGGTLTLDAGAILSVGLSDDALKAWKGNGVYPLVTAQAIVGEIPPQALPRNWSIVKKQIGGKEAICLKRMSPGLMLLVW